MFLELTISSANTGIAQPLQCGETRIDVFIRLYSNSFEETLKRLEWLDTNIAGIKPPFPP